MHTHSTKPPLQPQILSKHELSSIEILVGRNEGITAELASKLIIAYKDKCKDYDSLYESWLAGHDEPSKTAKLNEYNSALADRLLSRIVRMLVYLRHTSWCDVNNCTCGLNDLFKEVSVHGNSKI